MALGIFRQFIYVNPTKKLFIVRLAKNEGDADCRATYTSTVKYIESE
jgi:hypothetical protein